MKLDKIRVKVDTLSFKLNEQFDVKALENYCSKGIADENGVVTRTRVLPTQFGVYYTGKDIITASFWQGGEQEAMKIAKIYGLEVTRLDLTVDFPCEDKNEQLEVYRTWDGEIREILREKFNHPQIMTFEGQANPMKGNIGYGTSFWSRASDKQLRIYAKESEDGFSLRAEWQLRHSLARAVFAAIADSYPSNALIQIGAFRQICREYGIEVFPLPSGNEVSLVRPLVEKNTGNTEIWALTHIAPAFYRYQKSTGVDLAAMVMQEVERLGFKEATEAAEYQKTLYEKKTAKVQHQIKRKLSRRYVTEGD